MEPQLPPLPSWHARHTLPRLRSGLCLLPYGGISLCNRHEQQQQRHSIGPMHPGLHMPGDNSQSPRKESPLLAVVRNPTICGAQVAGQIGRRRIQRYGCHPSQMEGVCEAETRRHSKTNTRGWRGESMAESTQREDGQRVRDWGNGRGGICSDGCSLLPCCPVPLCPTGPSSTLLRKDFGEDAETGMESRCMPFGGTSKVLAGGITATNWCPSGLGPWISILVLLTHSPCQVSTYRMDCRMRDLVASSLLMMRGDAVRAPAGRCA
ncbi:hypothetical protein TgHK011_004597 [Trichoderma gracile]|nr:hypothetical protein TgHK011_004597 [Trichoderma gracile]